MVLDHIAKSDDFFVIMRLLVSVIVVAEIGYCQSTLLSV